ncbi:MAG TPA: hypothetical protein VMI33_13370 [Streptosporangiaceae bacterium]|nr:hypothetical protein [Streptosporangiaceae bacterium]
MSAGTWRLPEGGDDRPTFLAHAMALSALHGQGPWPGEGYPLPDAAPDPEQPFLSGSVADGIATHHGSVRPDQSGACLVADQLQELVAAGQPAGAGLDRLHDTLADRSTLTIADGVSDAIGDRNLPRDRVHAVGRWLAEYGVRRNAVAAGLVLTGLTGDDRDRDLLLLLGGLEDLTLYAAVALRSSQPDPDQAMFDLARRVRGWGRIHAVERLRGSTDPAIRAWLLREGFRNGVMNSYLAHLAATTGDLYGALAETVVDDPLLDGAGDILDALCVTGGPAADITSYGDGPAAIERYLTLSGPRPPTAARVAVVLRLGRFIASDPAAGLGWTAADRARLALVCASLTARPAWREVVDRALNAADLGVFRQAIWPAGQLGIPARDRIRARLRADPSDGYLWQSLADDIDEVLDLAYELLPLADLATGPTTETGIGGLRSDGVLDLLVSRLGQHPGKGWPLIRAALGNRTIRNRNMAVRALRAWPPDTIPAEVARAVQAAHAAEPDPKVRDAMRRLLRQWTARPPRRLAP